MYCRISSAYRKQPADRVSCVSRDHARATAGTALRSTVIGGGLVRVAAREFRHSIAAGG
jgi:hypothetical protein